MTVREFLSYFLLVIFPIFEFLCYFMLRQKKNEIVIRKRDIKMIYVITIASWVAYLMLVNSLFDIIYCGIYRILIILLSPLSVGPQLLRGIRLWGMLKQNKILLSNVGGNNITDTVADGGLKRGDSLSMINEINSSQEEISQSEVHIHVNKRSSTDGKLQEIKAKLLKIIGFTRFMLITIPLMLIASLLVMTERDKIFEIKFERCFPESTFSLITGSSLSFALSIAAFSTTIVMSQCNDELGIKKEIIRNIAILFMTNTCAFVCRYFGYVEWQSVVYVIQQIMLSFSMIIMPCMYDSSVVTWMNARSKKKVPGYARPLPQLPHHTRDSILLPSKRTSQLNQKENDKREREITISLDAGLCILLSSREGIEAFTEHCAREFSVENITFWSEINALHRAIDLLRDSEENSSHTENDIYNFAQEIHQTFIKDGAEMQINISEAQSMAIYKELESGGTIGRTLFDKAQKEIYALMSQHSYPRFLSSNSNSSYKEKMKQKKSNRNSIVRVAPGR